MFLDIFILTVVFLMFFFLIRAELTMVIHSLIKKPYNRRKRTEGQSFLDWLIYRKFLDIMPKSDFILYYVNIFLYLVTLVVIVLLHLFKYQEIAGKIQYVYFCIIAVPTTVLYSINKTKLR